MPIIGRQAIRVMAIDPIEPFALPETADNPILFPFLPAEVNGILVSGVKGAIT